MREQSRNGEKLEPHKRNTGEVEIAERHSGGTNNKTWQQILCEGKGEKSQRQQIVLALAARVPKRV